MKTTPRILSFLLIISLLCTLLAMPAAAEKPADVQALLTYHAVPAQSAPVTSQTVDGQTYLFLPSSADLHDLPLYFAGETCKVIANGRTVMAFSGQPFDFLALFPSGSDNGRYTANFLIDGRIHPVCLMQSSGLHSLYITSADPEKGHAYVDASKSNKAKNNELVLLDADGHCIYADTMKEIKGRGNSTWSYAKKPYQIKLSEKVDLLGNGADEAAKTWILLANYADGALIRNSMTNDLAAALGIRYTHNDTFVDLYYDGAYCGTYLLTEKTEIGDGRIEIHDLEKEIEEVNGEDIDFDDLPTAVIRNAANNPMQVVGGITLPENYTGGYLLELDYESRAKEEKSWFRSSNGDYVVCKAPEYLPAEAMSYVSDLYQHFEDAVYNGGTHPTTGKSYTDYMDLDSLSKMYLLLALSQNGDAFRSSTYFHIPENEHKIYAGPLWDFDTAYGLYTVNEVDGFIPARSQLVQKLLQIDSFRAAVQEQWDNCLQPIIQNTVLNPSVDHTADGVGSIAHYGAQLTASRAMDAVRWGKTDTYADHISVLYAFMQEACLWTENVLTNPETTWDANGFVDVAKNAWYKDAVTYVTEKGYFSGYSAILFQPEKQMDRSMLVTVLHRMAGKPMVSGTCPYADVPDGTWYSDAVLWAHQQALTHGSGKGRFGVSEALTREQLVVFLHRFAGLTGNDTASMPIPDSFCDTQQVSAWAEEAIGWALKHQILTGASVNCRSALLPQQPATRAEVAAILQRYDVAISR